jgi:DNA-binding CsgD family transcriptional regulator
LSNSAALVPGEPSTPGLLEREAELQVIEDALAAGRAGYGRLVLVEGHAGIGKSRLLDAAVASARASSVTVLRARASELESGFAFGVALQLFEPVLAGADDEQRDRLLTGAAALAAPLLERPTGWGGDEPEERSYPVMHGLFWVLANLADTGPALIVVDDAHWADRPSLRLLLYLLQRVEELPVTIVAARRLGEPGAPDDLLGQLGAHASTRRARPGPLSREATRAMVGAGLPDADEAFADACWRMTEGNPFLLGELVGAVRAEAWEPTERNAGRIGTLAPEAVLRAVAVRLMRLSDEAAGVARAVAVLGDDAQLRRIAALTDREPGTVAAAIDALAASEILRPTGPDAVTFAHPLLASAVYADVGLAERAALHRRAAEILRAEDVSPERVAAHLVPSPGSGEAWVVEVLRASARRAMGLGAPESAASYLSRALEEPPVGGDRAGVLRELGIAEAATGLPGGAARLQEAVASADTGADRADGLLALGGALGVQGRRTEAVEVLRRAAAEPQALPGVAVRATAEAITIELMGPDRRPALLADPLAVPAADAPETPGQRSLLAVCCLQQAMIGAPRQDVLALARRALGDGALLAEVGPGAGAYAAVASALCACDELAWAEAVLNAATAEARAAGSTMALATANCMLAVARWGQGHLNDALACAEQALASERQGWRHLLPAARGTAVGVLLDRGDLEAAGELVEREPLGEAGGLTLGGLFEARGRLALLQRRDADALTAFEAWRDARAGVRNPAAGAAWRSACALALTRLGRGEEARELAGEEVALTRAFGARGALSAALRAQAHVESETDIERTVQLLQEAVETAAGGEARLEHARGLIELGIALRRAGRRSDAGRALGDALELARTFGAGLLEERAAEELEVAGARVQRAALRGADALSPSERRVVALAVDGLTNREIAEALFVTRKAVEWHLGNAFRKLDVRSRRDLPAAMAGSGETSPAG